MSKCEVTEVPTMKLPVFDVKLRLTMAELVALRNALNCYGSSVGDDVFDYIYDACKIAKLDI